jgi:prepilin-type processing-associated H-X9-DG protein
LPAPVTIAQVMTYYHGLSNEIANPSLLICPADFRKPAANMANLTHTNMSYFTCVDASETFPQSFLAGDRNLMTNGVRIGPGILELASQTNVAWSSAMHRNLGNIVMGDGSVQLLNSSRLKVQLTNSGLSSMRVAVP